MFFEVEVGYGCEAAAYAHAKGKYFECEYDVPVDTVQHSGVQLEAS